MQIETCEICGKQFIAGYGYSIAASWLVTGHAYVRAYMCPSTASYPQDDPNAPQTSGQHWGCTPEHAVQALQKCLSDPTHMHQDGLLAKHKATEKPRYADEDAEWAKDKGDDFHIVELKKRMRSNK